MSSIKPSDKLSEPPARFNLLQALPAELRLVVFHDLVDAGEHDTLARLAQTSRGWQSYVSAEHPLFKNTFVKRAREPDVRESMHRAFETLIRANSPAFLAKFIVAAQDTHSDHVNHVLKTANADTITYLMLSARLGLENCVDVLLHFGANPLSTDPVDRSAASWAFEAHHLQVGYRLVGEMHQAGLRSRTRGLPTRNVPPVSFDKATKAGHMLIMRELLEKGEAGVVTDEHMLHAAKNERAVSMANLLLEYNPALIARVERATLQAIKSQPDPTPWIANIMKTEGHNLDAVKLLHAAAAENKFGTFKYLYGLQAHSVNLVDAAGDTFLNKAAHARNAAFVDFLLDRGADHRISPNSGSILYDAINTVGQYEACRYDGEPSTHISQDNAAIAKRLVKLEWPQSMLDQALIGAHEKARELGLERTYGAQGAVLVDIIATLKDKGATLPAPPVAPRTKPNIFKRMFGRSK